MRLIDSDVLIAQLRLKSPDPEGVDDWIKIINEQPTQKTGEWIDKEISTPDYPFQDRKIIECSKCHYGIVQARLGYTNYCPNCGAYMK